MKTRVIQAGRGEANGRRLKRHPVERTSGPGTGGVVRLVSVTKLYGTGAARVAALDEVSLELASGSFTAVIGPSGSGKSTGWRDPGRRRSGERCSSPSRSPRCAPSSPSRRNGQELAAVPT